MKANKLSIVFLMAVLSPLAFAGGYGQQPSGGCTLSDCSTTNKGGQGGDGGNAHQGQGQAQGQGQLQGQLQGQAQGQGQGQAQIGINESDNRNLNTNLNSSRSGSSSHSGSAAVSGAAAIVGGDHISNDIGPATTSSQSSTGASTATVGDTITGPSTATVGAIANQSSGGAGGDSGDHTSEVNVTDNSSYTEDNDYPSMQAASVFAGYCQTGASGQFTEGGFSVINTDQFCTYIRLADRMLIAAEAELAKCDFRCEGTCTAKVASVEKVQECGIEEQGYADEYMATYRGALDEASKLVMRSRYTAQVDTWTGQLLKIAAIIALFAL